MSSNFLIRINIVWLIVGMALLSIIVPSIIVSILAMIYNLKETEIGSIGIQKIIFALIIAPIVETLLFQSFAFWLLRRITIQNHTLICICSSFFFALAHSGIEMQLSSFFGGLIFSLTYLVCESRSESPFWITCIIHSIRNGFVLFLIFFKNSNFL